MDLQNILKRYKQSECPMCLDISYKDADGKEHVIYDICQVHVDMGFMEIISDIPDPTVG